MERTCCFTGHRPQKLPWGFHEETPGCKAVKKQLRDEVIRAVEQEGVRRFLSGMALGLDTWGAETVLALRKDWPITLECVLPCQGQAERWRTEDRKRYEHILQQCNRVILLQKSYTADCFRRRNIYLVDHSDLIIALWNGKPSGTGQTVNYAQKHHETLRFLQF